MRNDLVGRINDLEKKVRKVVVDNLDTMVAILSAKQEGGIKANFCAISPPEWFSRYQSHKKFAKAVRNADIPHEEFYAKLDSSRPYSLSEAMDLIRYAEKIPEDERWSYDVRTVEKETKREVQRKKRLFGLYVKDVVVEKKVEKEIEAHYGGEIGRLGVGSVSLGIEKVLGSHPRGAEISVIYGQKDLSLFRAEIGGWNRFTPKFWIGVFGTRELDISQIGKIKSYVHFAWGDGGFGDDYTGADRIVIYNPDGRAIYDKMKIGEPIAFVENDTVFVLGEYKQPNILLSWFKSNWPHEKYSQTYYDLGDGKVYVAGKEPGTVRALTNKEIDELKEKGQL